MALLSLPALSHPAPCARSQPAPCVRFPTLALLRGPFQLRERLRSRSAETRGATAAAVEAVAAATPLWTPPATPRQPLDGAGDEDASDAGWLTFERVDLAQVLSRGTPLLGSTGQVSSLPDSPPPPTLLRTSPDWRPLCWAPKRALTGDLGADRRPRRAGVRHGRAQPALGAGPHRPPAPAHAHAARPRRPWCACAQSPPIPPGARPNQAVSPRCAGVHGDAGEALALTEQDVDLAAAAAGPAASAQPPSHQAVGELLASATTDGNGAPLSARELNRLKRKARSEERAATTRPPYVRTHTPSPLVLRGLTRWFALGGHRAPALRTAPSPSATAALSAAEAVPITAPEVSASALPDRALICWAATDVS